MVAPTVLIVIPALNEVSTIGQVLDEIPLDELRRMGYEPRILVVDNGSSDGTRHVALEKGAEVVDEPCRGKGMAMRRAFRDVSADFVFMLDGDATYPPSNIPGMLHVLEEGHDVVIGSRLAGTRAPGSISRLNVIGNRLLTLLACTLYGVRPATCARATGASGGRRFRNCNSRRRASTWRQSSLLRSPETIFGWESCQSTTDAARLPQSCAP